jgi:hypothetical protein
MRSIASIRRKKHLKWGKRRIGIARNPSTASPLTSADTLVRGGEQTCFAFAPPSPYRLASSNLDLAPTQAIEDILERSSITAKQREEARHCCLGRLSAGGGIFQHLFEPLENVVADDASADTSKSRRPQKSLGQLTSIGG